MQYEDITMMLQTKLRRGPSTTAHTFIPEKDEWCYCTDTKKLRKGDGKTPGGLEDQYKGGPISVYHPGFGWFSPPHAQSHWQFNTRVLEPGEIVYVDDEDWCYIGDGETPGGNKAQ